jgi:hypothetical protein
MAMDVGPARSLESLPPPTGLLGNACLDSAARGAAGRLISCWIVGVDVDVGVGVGGREPGSEADAAASAQSAINVDGNMDMEDMAPSKTETDSTQPGRICPHFPVAGVGKLVPGQ